MREPRTLRPVPDPFGSYMRPGYQDHGDVLQLLVEGRSIGSGLVADLRWASRQGDMLAEARRCGVETVLDPRSVDLSTPGGFVRGHARELPWAATRPHRPFDLTDLAGAAFISSIVDAVQHGQFSAVLAPTHYLAAAGDPWLAVDGQLTVQLRRELDRRGLDHVLIYYPLIMKADLLRRPEVQREMVAALGSPLPIDALWLRVHPFGTTNSGPLVLRRYLEMCRALHQVGVPLVAEHSGGVGVALLAFGAVGGIESGITYAEAVNLDNMFKPPRPEEKGFSPVPRPYLHELAAFLDPGLAEDFFARRGMKTAHGCQDAACCPRGWRDMQLQPRRHFLLRRAREVAAISAAPPSLRAGYYMENFLRPASDRAVRAAEAAPALHTVRRRLDSWRGTLGAELDKHSAFTASAPAAGKRLRRSA